MNIQEMEKIEEALRKHEITYAEATKKIYGSTTKPWHTTAWKKKRDELIKQTCEQCGSTKGPMVLQHLWHPPTYKEHIREIYEQFHFKAQNNSSLPEATDEEAMSFLAQFTELKEACPSCSMRSIDKRKTMTPTYRCRKCNHEFNEPKMVPYNTKLRVVAPSIDKVKRRITYQKQQEYMWNTFGEEIRTLAVLKGIEGHKRYISMEDTKTYCKRCAFLWDKKRLKVCDVCKENLIDIFMHACDKCQKDGHPFFYK
jgi:ribosomal protein L37AE/L43A